jgi:tRNA (mo5U34)-methyltransferase
VSAETLTREDIERRVAELGDWFHNLDLNGVNTAPHHFLGDYPRVKWQRFSSAIPADLRGRSVLDIGCNAGFYAIEMKRRGADRVVAVDSDPRYLAQARFAADVMDADIEFREMSVYQLPALGERFDVVLFMGVLYHLRYPLLALDISPRTRDAGSARLPVDAARQPGRETLRRRLRLQRHRAFRQSGIPATVFRRAPVRRRSDQLVGAQPRVR